MRSVVFVVFVFPVFFFSCSSDNVTVDDHLQRYFDSAGVKGAFGMFDNGHGHFTISNLSRFTDSFYTPGATFDILQSLVAIQRGIKKDDSAESDTPMPYGGLTGPPPNFGQEFRDTGMTNELAFLLLGKEISRDTLKKWVDSLQYGNKVIRDSTVFWQDDGLKINCDQQLGLLKKLYFNQLPFFQRTQEIVCRMMPAEDNPAYRLSYKTALGKTEDGRVIGWVMGWVEENKHPYFFVVNLELADPAKDLRQTGLFIAKKILSGEGLLAGKK